MSGNKNQRLAAALGDEHADLVVVLNWFQELTQRVGK